MTILPAPSFVRAAQSLRGLPLIVGLVLTSMAGLQAQTTVWMAGTGDWNTASNWDYGVPSAASGAFLANGGTAQLTAANGVGDFLWVLNGAVEISGSGFLTINGAGSTGNNIGSNGIGTLSISGAAAGASISTNAAEALRVGYNSQGFVNLLDGGTLTLQGGNGTMSLGYFNGREGTLNIGTGGAAGILNASTVSTRLGSGTVNFDHTDADYYFTKDGTSGGTGVVIGTSTSVFHLGTGRTTLVAASSYTGGTTVTGGTLRATTSASALGAGGLTLNGGNLELANDTGLSFGRNTLVQQNGTITSDRLTAGVGVTHTLGTLSIGSQVFSVWKGANVTGGTAGLTFGATTLTANAATFDTASGTTLTVGALSGDYSFSKQGAGTMVLSAASSRGGAATTLDGGTLRLENGNALGSGGGYFTAISGTLELAGDVSTAFNTGSSFQPVYITTIASDRLTAGTGVTHTINSEISIYSGLIVGKGSHVTSGTAGLIINSLRLTSTSSIVQTEADTHLTVGSAFEAASGRGFSKQGAGTMTLSGVSDYSGATYVSAGKLVVDGSITGSSAVTVNFGATLAGSGSIAGTVTVDNGGILSPGNSPGVLTVGALTLNNTSILNYELGSPASDRVDVTGALTLDGILNVQAAVGFGEGTYRLINYGGALTDNALTFGLVPAPFEYAISTDIAGQVNLTVTAASLQYWDGAQTSPNGIVNGGTGAWDSTTTNWTTSSGNANSTWDGSVGAVFKGTAGTATIANGTTISAPLLSFQVDGYTVASAGTGQLDLTDTGTVEVFTGATATISAAIASGQLTKTQGGILILTGANTYAGGTTLEEGTLVIGHDDALGTGALTINAGTVATDGGIYFVDNDLVVNSDVTFVIPESGGTPGALELHGDIALGSATRTFTLVGEDGTWCSGGVISGTGGLNFQTTANSFAVMYCGLADNTYTGLTTVGNNVDMLLGTDGTAIAGDLVVQSGGFVGLDLDNQFGATSKVTVDGALNLYFSQEQTIHHLLGSGTIVGPLVAPATLTVDQGDFTGTIIENPLGGDALTLRKETTGSLRLSGANTYSGGTVINAGTLTTDNTSALGTGAITLGSAGTLAVTSGSTLANVSGLDWADGGTFEFTLGAVAPIVSIVTIDGAVAQTGSGVFTFANGGGFLSNTTYDLITFDTAGSILTDWTANVIGGLLGNFLVRDNLDGSSTLTVMYTGASIGPVINNFAPDFTPVNADFLVAGSVTALMGPQQVATLTFADGSSLTILDTLSVNTGDFTVTSGAASISGGALLTPGDFNKLGSGLLNVLSNIITGGNTNIASGILAINGSLTTDNVLVQLGAWLKGSGLINGNVINSGTVAPGNSPGTLTINGNFTQTSSGTLQIEVADNAFDQLIVTGQASLAGTLQAVAFGGHEFAYGDQVAFLQAGSISGGFDNIVMSNPSQFRGRFLVNGGTGILLVAPTSYTLVAQNQNQTNVARALDSFIGASGDRDAVSLALDLQTESQYGNAFAQIAPGFYQTLTDTVIEQTTAQNQMLAQRLSAVRLGVGGFNVIGLDQAAIKNDRDGKNVMDARSDKDIISPATATKWSVFVQGNGIFSRVMNVSQVPNYRFNSGGFIVGADYTFGGESIGAVSTGGKSVVTAPTVRDSSLTLGLYTGYQGTYAKYANSSNMSINSALFGGYATYANGGFYSDLIIGGAYNGYRASRSIDFSTIDRTARSTPNGGSFSTYLDLGYDWKVGGFTFGPIVSGQYVYAGTSPFTENGADSLDLRVSQQNANSLRTNLGGRVAYTWQVADNITIIPEGRLFWQHEYLNGPSTIGASLDGGNGPGFDFQTSAPGRDSVFAGVGVSANFGDRWNTAFYYNADFGRQDYISHMISTSLSWKF